MEVTIAYTFKLSENNKRWQTYLPQTGALFEVKLAVFLQYDFNK